MVEELEASEVFGFVVVLGVRSPGLAGGVLGARGSDPGVHASTVTLHGAQRRQLGRCWASGSGACSLGHGAGRGQPARRACRRIEQAATLLVLLGRGRGETGQRSLADASRITGLAEVTRVEGEETAAGCRGLARRVPRGKDGVKEHRRAGLGEGRHDKGLGAVEDDGLRSGETRA